MEKNSSVSVKKNTLILLKQVTEKTKKLNANREPPIKITRDTILNHALKQVKGGINFD